MIVVYHLTFPYLYCIFLPIYISQWSHYSTYQYNDKTSSGLDNVKKK